MLEVKLLGQFSVTLNGCLVNISARPAQLLLAYLLLNTESPQPREVVADLLWPDSSAENARANLRHALWQLRAAIDPLDDAITAATAPAESSGYIIHNPQVIVFNRHSPYTLDVDMMERDRPNWTAAALMDAVAAYGGELLPGFYESWIVLERERLSAVFDRRMDHLLNWLIEEHRWDDTLTWAERWIALDRAPEAAYRALMQANVALGDSGRAMIAFRRCREALWEELGVEPSPETRRLAESLVHGIGPAGENPRQAVVAPPRHALPGDRQALEMALALAEAERQRAEFYRRVLGLATITMLAVGAVLGGRWRRQR